jgi:tetratricopeptide (TPR) repeat protein
VRFVTVPAALRAAHAVLLRVAMREHYEPPSKYTWIVYAFAMVLVGVLAGYVLGSTSPARASVAPAAAATTTAAAPTPVVDESELRGYRDILARDPKNRQAAVKAGNLLYDAKRYPEAIGFYQQAFAINPSDINVSTDLGTALWYAGRADEALTQYEKSLAIDRNHAQTLFNLGVVRADGKHDYTGAIEAWEQLLKTNPTYPEAERVRLMIADARRSS